MKLILGQYMKHEKQKWQGLKILFIAIGVGMIVGKLLAMFVF